MKPIVAFDYDGVLADTFEANIAFINKGIASVGSDVVVTPAHFEAVDEISFEQVTTLAGFDQSLFPQFMDFVIKEGGQVIAVSQLFDGISELLEKLKGNAHIIVVSNNHSAVVQQVLSRLGVVLFFDKITGGENNETKEQRLIEACNSFDTPLDKCWMIGDGVNDIESAHTAGCKSIAVSWGFQSLEKLKKCKPTECAENPSEIFELVF